MPAFSFVNRVLFEPGAIGRIGAEIGRLGMRRPLVVTDRGIAAAGLLERLRAAWPQEASWTVFDGTPPNPTEEAVLAALDVFRGAGCDGVVAMGGGSPIDLGKAVNLLATHEGPLAGYEAGRKGMGRIKPVGPLVAIPTTAGTGSEVSVGTVIVTRDGRKATIASPHLIPVLALCDPQLTMGLPPLLTAATGMDAVTHCIEAVLSPLFNPVADAIGLDGLERALAGGALERAVRDGGDVAARSEMMMAAIEGALAFTKGLGAAHAMSHAAGRLPELKLHHGTLNAIILPGVLRRNAAGAPEGMARIARAMELAGPDEVPGAILALNARLGLPASLAAMGVTRAHLPDLVEHALGDVSGLTNPVRLDGDDYRALFEDLL